MTNKCIVCGIDTLCTRKTYCLECGLVTARENKRRYSAARYQRQKSQKELG